MNCIAVIFALQFVIDIADFGQRACFAVWNIEEIVPLAIFAAHFGNNMAGAAAGKDNWLFTRFAIGEAVLDPSLAIFLAL